ncbi:MAG: hypothetical protein QNJ70_29640 [Xenococcaceae cyanobacterium MO_207.B15]|nr:hypothetical protein [Xenococcaceae cyanobacterium MO_207.B15]
MSEKKPVLGIAFVISEPIEAQGLQVLKVYRRGNSLYLGEGQELVISALIESLSHLEASNHTVLFLAVDERGEKKSRGLYPVDGGTQQSIDKFQDPLIFNSFDIVPTTSKRRRRGV